MTACVAHPNAQDSIDPTIVGIDRSHRPPPECNLGPISQNCDCTAQMADSDQLYTGMEVDDDLSSAMGIETLADRDLGSPGFDNAARGRTEGLEIEISTIADT